MEPITLIFMLCVMMPVAFVKAINMSMEDQSVDDMYYGCTEEMAEIVQHEFFDREMKEPSFKEAWQNAETCVKKAKKKQKRIDKALTREHLQAICVYTAETPTVYPDFNRNVRESAKQYTKSFKYHALHFWLTSAIQILNKNNQMCHQTVRRSKDTFIGEMNQIFRFGSFASTSYRKDLWTIFGEETCFSITTCLGAYLKQYPHLEDSEEEVLIPPYEMFEITYVTEDQYKDIEHCRKTYVLESVGIHSNLNCKAVPSEDRVENKKSLRTKVQSFFKSIG